MIKQACAIFDETAEGRQQLGDVVEMQAGGRLVEDIQRAFAGSLGQVRGQFHALRLAAGKRGGGLAQPQVAEAHIGEHLELLRDALLAVEKRDGFTTVSCNTSCTFSPL